MGVRGGVVGNLGKAAGGLFIRLVCAQSPAIFFPLFLLYASSSISYILFSRASAFYSAFCVQIRPCLIFPSLHDGNARDFFIFCSYFFKTIFIARESGGMRGKQEERAGNL